MQQNPHCRIGTVRYKNSNLIEIKPRQRGLHNRQRFHKYLDEMYDQCGSYGLAGIAIIAWDFNGYFTRARQIHQDSPIGGTMLPSFAAEVLRRDVMSDVAHDVFLGE